MQNNATIMIKHAVSCLSLVVLAAPLAFTSSAFAANLGDPAAPLNIKEWVKGQSVNVTDEKHTYVVEFWATWCGPCRMTIPHLTSLQKKYKAQGVVFVGISDEAPETIKPFVQQMGTNMDYTIAADEDRKSSTNYMEVYGQMGIPTAFLVSKEAKVLWVGHPLMGLEEALEQVLANKYDVKAANQKFQFRSLLQQYQQFLAKGDSKTAELGPKLFADAGSDLELLSELASGIFARGMMPKADVALAEQVLSKAEKIGGAKNKQVWSIRADKYQYLSAKGDPKAGEFGRSLLADASNDPEPLGDLAFGIVANMRNPKRDFALASEALDKAAKLSGPKNPRILAIRGIAEFESGKQQEGLALAKQASQLATNDMDKARYDNYVRFMESRMNQGGNKK
jgi:thiol-disulfide isomerase/thioredoxin